MTWQIYALIASVMMAGFIHMNHVLKLDGVVLTWLRSILGVVIFAPVFFLLPLPSSPHFYALAVVSAFIGAMADVLIYNTARKFGSRITSTYLPIKIWVAFMVWGVVDPSFFTTALQNPLNLSVTILCFVLCSIAAVLVRRNDFSARALPVLFVIGIMLGAADVLGKNSMVVFDGLSIALVFLAIIMVVNLLATTFILLATKPAQMKVLFSKQGVVAMLVAGSVFAGWLTSFIFALHLAPNPAYVGVATLLAVVWLMVYHKIRKSKEEGSTLAAIMFAVGAAGLLLFAP